MAIQKVYLDPNAAAYTPNEIVGKVNDATANITRANALAEVALPAETTTFQKVTEAETTKLAGIEAGAEVNPADLAELDPTANTKLTGIEAGAEVNPTATEVRDQIVGIDDLDRKIVISRPASGQKKIIAIQTHSDGKTEIEQNDTVEP